MNSRVNNVLLGIPVGQESLETAIESALSAIEKESLPLVFACAMAHSVNVAQTDETFNKALRDADLVVADGVGVTLMARLAKVDVGARVAGEEFFSALMDTLDKRGQGRIFFFGSTEKVLDLISRRVKQDYPNLDVCGTLSPPYRPWSADENKSMIETIMNQIQTYCGSV